MAGLPIDRRGFPVPWFVQWLKDGKACRTGEGEPDFRILNREHMRAAIKFRRCAICGDPLGTRMAFAIGPMCVVSRVSGEPPNHRACAEFAARHCPFMTNPRMRRNDKDMPAHVNLGGVQIERNPGVTALWITRSYQSFRPDHGDDGVLFRIGPAEQVAWWAEGRAATRAEVVASIDSGLPVLRDVSRAQGIADAELEVDIATAMSLVPAA
ncbi:MAG TPA: hypothetical protein VK630_04200 [Reyranella sp.]|nr:hypothetical protein [Reyranella sp.]